MDQETLNSNTEIEEELTSDGLHKSGIEREVDDDNSEISNPFDPNDIAIVTKNPSIDSVIKRVEHKEIELNPDFQRKGGIWQIKEKSRLIESLLLNIPLPVFYVAADKDDNWIVVDGLQRLTTLKEYIQDKTLILKNLEFLTQFEGLNPSSSLKLTITYYFNKLKFLFFLSWHYRFFVINYRLAFTYR
ncbi:MAG: DUF262 domain-containing protein, partial [Methylococcales bacterium]|nr:DUF262 domain-containing protein [Methylococcales bacterium]